MLIFAHLGLTLALANIARKIYPRLNPSLAFVALGSLLPDIIDKPLGYLIFGDMGTGRIFAHTLLFIIVLAAIATALRSRELASLAGGVFAHLIEDSMWKMPAVLFWPLLGSFPVNPPQGVLSYIQMLLMGLQNPAILVPEILGFAYLLYLASQMRPTVVTRIKTHFMTGGGSD